MNKQKEMNERNDKQEYFDIRKEPEKIINNLEDKIKEGKNDLLYDKSYNNWSRNLIYNNFNDINLVKSYDLEKLKKKNLLTEYACFEKAKNNFEFQQIKIKYNI